MPSEPTGLEHLTPLVIESTSATERAGFRKCRRQWFLTVGHRLDPQEGNVHFFLGTVYHAGLEAYYKAIQEGIDHDGAAALALDAYQEAYDRELDVIKAQLGFLWKVGEPAFREFGEMGMDMLQNYLERERVNPLFDQVLAVEVRVNVPIRRKRGRAIGTLSVQTDVVGMKDGELAVADHKTASREPNIAHLDIDDQLSAEVFAVWMDGGKFPTRAIYNVSMKKKVGPPERLKDKKDGTPKLSKAKGQGTTYALYVQALDELGLPHDDYQDILAHLRAVDESGDNPLFVRDTTFRTPGQMAAFQADLYEEFRDMREVGKDPRRAYPNPTPDNCKWCPVRVICTTIQDGGDVESVIKGGFIVADPRR